MKHATLSAFVLLLLCLNSTAQKTKTKNAANTTTQPVDLPYTATYSSQYTMGNPAHAKMILDAYRHYENGTTGNPNFFADTARMIVSGMPALQGRDKIEALFTEGRSALSKSQFIPSAVVSLRSTDRNEDWVSVWGTQNNTMKDGSEASLSFNHIWRINKDGRVDYVEMLERRTPQQ